MSCLGLKCLIASLHHANEHKSFTSLLNLGKKELNKLVMTQPDALIIMNNKSNDDVLPYNVTVHKM